MARLETTTELACPFIDEDDVRCARHFSLSRLEQAFHVCANGGHGSCPIYQQMLGEQQRRETSRLTIAITIEGYQPHRRLAAGDAPTCPAPLSGFGAGSAPARRFRFRPWHAAGKGEPDPVTLRATGS